MSRMAREYFDLNYEANMRMKEEYNENKKKLSELEKRFNSLVNGSNLTLENFEFEEKVDDDFLYNELDDIYNKRKELKEEINALKKELEHIGFI